MANWKERGYVLDSDEEDWDVEDATDAKDAKNTPAADDQLLDELCSRELSPPRVATASKRSVVPPPRPASDEAQATARSASPAQGDAFSPPSSSIEPPLPTQSSLPAISELIAVAAQPPSEIEVLETAASEPHPQSEPRRTDLAEKNSDAIDDTAFQPRISLRKRNPIQLHPYLLESERYRKTLKGRGLKPVRLEGDEDQPSEDSQADEYINDDSLAAEDGLDSQEILDEHSNDRVQSELLPQAHPERRPASLVSELGNEVSRPLKRVAVPISPNAALSVGNKRRKLDFSVNSAQPLVRPSRDGGTPATRIGYSHDRTSGFRLPTIASYKNDGLLLRESAAPTPASLPRTPSQVLHPDLIDVDSSPPLADDGASSYPTPLASSIREMPVVQIPSSQPSLSAISATEADSSSDSEPQRQAYIKRYGRRMKGVLPASWLRLDHPNSRTPQMKRHRGTQAHLASTTPAAGVARRLSPSRRRVQDAPMVLFEDSEDEPPEIADLCPRSPISSEPPQSSIHSYVNVLSRRPLWEPPEIDPVRPPRRQKVRTKPSQAGPRLRAVALSILDAPAAHTVALPKSPQFIKLAKRNARAKPSLGRHLPSHKVFRMHDAESIRDVNRTLSKWRQGQIKAPKLSVPRRPRPRIEPNLPPEWSRPVRTTAQLPLSPISSSHQNITPKLPAQEIPHQFPTDEADRKSVGSTKSKQQPIITPHKTSQQHTRRRAPIPHHAEPRTIQLERDARPGRSTLPKSSRKDLRRVRTLLLGRDLIDTSETSLPLARYLQESEVPYEETAQVYEPPSPITPTRSRPHLRPPRKQTPQYRPWITDEIVVDHTAEPIEVQSNEPSSLLYLQGLNPYGQTYTTNFDVFPFQLGTYLHEASYLGSGSFRSALDTHRDLSIDAGYSSFRFEERLWQWGHWQDDVAQDIGKLLRRSIDVSESDEQGHPTYAHARSICSQLSEYLSKHLSFTDPIDRANCSNRLVQSLDELITNLDSVVARTQEHLPVNDSGHDIPLLGILMTVAAQVVWISTSPLVNPAQLLNAWSLVSRIGRLLIRVLVQRNRGTSLSIAGRNGPVPRQRQDVCLTSVVDESWIMAYNCLKGCPPSLPGFWAIVNQVICTDDLSLASSISVFERIWRWQLHILPLLEIGTDGIHVIGARFKPEHKVDSTNWRPISAIIQRLSIFVSSNEQPQGATFNAYIRATIARCFYLIQGWGWIGNDHILGALFDIFAARDLSCLLNEDMKGSPCFIEQLHRAVNIDTHASDTSYQLFLKLLAVGLRSLSSVASAKQMNNAVFRLIPNHGRYYRKEETIKQENLDSLRNHFDLLTVLHWASPPSSRPQLSVISQLIDPDSSHREALRTSIQAWTNLIRFQITSGEDPDVLRTFSAWHARLIHSALRQHRMARVEVEAQATTIRSRGVAVPSSAHAEKIIGQNQSQVEIILVDLLLALRTAISLAPGAEEAHIMLNPHTVAETLSLFSSGQCRSAKVLDQLLDLLREYCQLCMRPSSSNNSSTQLPAPADDSQDSWSCLDLAPPSSPAQAAAVAYHTSLHRPLFQLLSSLMSSHQPSSSLSATAAEDSTLLRLVDTWAATAQLMLTFSLQSWDDYFAPFAAFSWDSLQASEQRARFGPRFLARCVGAGALGSGTETMEVEMDAGTRALVLRGWFAALAVRDALLRFQHELTGAVLDRMAGAAGHHPHPLFGDGNLPFVRSGGDGDGEEGRFLVSLSELKARRALMVEVMLENAQKALGTETGMDAGMVGERAGDLRSECADVVGALLLGMRAELVEQRGQQQHGGGGGAYGQLVRRVVDAVRRCVCLGDLCPVDPIFDGLLGGA